MTTLRLVAAGNPTKSPDGALGLLVFLALAVVVYFLFRSMNKHLRKVARAKFDGDGGASDDDRATPAQQGARAAAGRGKAGSGRPPRPRPHP